MFTLNDLFEIAVKMEKNAEAIYQKSVQDTDDPELKSLLEWMAKEETHHSSWFETRKSSLIIEKAESDLKKMVPGALQDMMGEKGLSLDDVDFSTIKNTGRMIDTFIRFEQETIQFYELLEMFIEDEKAAKGIRTIIDEERQHIEKLKAMKP